MKKIIDLSKPIYDGMPVYPGDPDVTIQTIGSYEESGYIVQKMSFGNHTGTHIDVPLHMVESGKSLDDFSIHVFYGRAVKFVKKIPKPFPFQKRAKIFILDEVSLTNEDISMICKSQITLLGLGEKCGIEVSQVKNLLENGIIVVNDLIHVDLLPNSFIFSAFPLPIRKGDGSPVRAVAYV